MNRHRGAFHRIGLRELPHGPRGGRDLACALDRDSDEMLHRLGNSTRARQAFIRHLFRYFMGRNEMLSDSQTLIEAEKSYLDNGGSFKALVVSLLSSDSFLYRR